jgi:hypothetical protein
VSRKCLAGLIGIGDRDIMEGDRGRGEMAALGDKDLIEALRGDVHFSLAGNSPRASLATTFTED